MRDKVGFITGGGSGIGRETALRLAGEGARMLVSDVNLAAAQETASLIGEAGGQAVAAQVDVRDRTQIEAAGDARRADLRGAASPRQQRGRRHEPLLRRPHRGCLGLRAGHQPEGPVPGRADPRSAHRGGRRRRDRQPLDRRGPRRRDQRIAPPSRTTTPPRAACRCSPRRSPSSWRIANIRVNCVAPGPIATNFFDLEGVTSPEAMQFLEPAAAGQARRAARRHRLGRLVAALRRGQLDRRHPASRGRRLVDSLSPSAQESKETNVTKREGFLPVDELESAGITTVMVVTPDIAGRLVGRRVPVEVFLEIADHGLEICTCAWAWDVDQSFELIDAGKFAICSMDNGAPDVPAAPRPGIAAPGCLARRRRRLFGDPEDPVTGEPLALSPRTILKRQIAALKEKGLTPQIGTELEFYLFENNPRSLRKSGFREELEPTTLYPSDFMIQEGNALRAVLPEAARRPQGQRHPRGGRAERVGHRAVGDDLRLRRRTRDGRPSCPVQDGSARLGHPRRHERRRSWPSRWPTRRAPPVTCTARSWTTPAHRRCGATRPSTTSVTPCVTRSAGVLEHLPEFMLWYVPTINGYVRSNSQDVAGFGRTWGIDNRSCSVRVVGHAPESLRFEFRIPGADTNPYLTLSGMFASVRRRRHPSAGAARHEHRQRLQRRRRRHGGHHAVGGRRDFGASE